MNSRPEITQLLFALRSGDKQAEQELLDLVYHDLRRMAGYRLAKEAKGQTLQATALVHEAWIRLMGACEGSFENRRHFFCSAAEAMRRILVENARRKKRLKRGGPDALRCEVHEFDLVDYPIEDELLDLETALAEFELQDPLKAQVVKLKFFLGLSNQEIAEFLDLSLATVERYWKFSRAWLFRRMNP